MNTANTFRSPSGNENEKSPGATTTSNEQDMNLREHMLSRGWNPNLHRNVHLDEDAQCATLMLFAPTLRNPKLTGFQTYKPGQPKTRDGKGMNPRDLKYFTHMVEGELAMFGVESLAFHHGYVLLVEGVFDAMKLHALGHPCLAVLGNDPKRLRPFLKATSREVVGVLDNDEAGLKLGRSCHQFYLCDEGRDPGDMTDLELRAMLCDSPRYKFVNNKMVSGD